MKKSKKFLIQAFEDFENRWDVKYYNSKINYKYPKGLLGDYICDRSEKVQLNAYPEEDFDILQVTNQNGVSYSYTKQGKEFNQSYKKVYTNDLVYNPYRINVGSIGLVASDCNEMYVSPAYVVFYINSEKLLPEFLYYLMKTSWYNPVIRANTSGSVRQNLTFDLLKNLEIPIIPVTEQIEILEEIKKLRSRIDKAQDLKEKLLEKIDKKFYKALGLTPKVNIKLPKVLTVDWAGLSRWGIRYNQNKQIGFDITTGLYEVEKLASIVEKIQYGSSEKANIDGIGIPILRMNNIKKRFLDTTDLKHIELTESQQKELFLEDGDILIIRTNGSRSLVGTCAVFDESIHGESEKYVFASYLIRIRLKKDLANPHFISWFLNSKLGREQIEMVSRQIMQNNINSQEILDLEIPLPKKTIQDSIYQDIKRQLKRSGYIENYLSKMNQNLDEYLLNKILFKGK